MENDETISKLLRLKRYEQPPEGYFDRFLEDFQDRQRSELLRRPVLSILWERLCAIAPNFEVPRLAYAAVAACAVLGAVAVVGGPDASPVASSADVSDGVSLASTKAPTIGNPAPVVLASAPSRSAVHYVLPTRPVSYASTSGF